MKTALLSFSLIFTLVQLFFLALPPLAEDFPESFEDFALDSALCLSVFPAYLAYIRKY
jgi:hypothetical protein